MRPSGENIEFEVTVGDDPYEMTRRFGKDDKTSVWQNAGVMQ